jgi:hypothetical protein
MIVRTRYALIALVVGLLTTAGLFWTRPRHAHRGASAGGGPVSLSGRPATAASPTVIVWTNEAPPLPHHPSELDGYIGKVVARVDAYPETLDASLEQGLAVIAEFGSPEGNLKTIIEKQDEFSAKMKRIAGRVRTKPVELPPEVTASVERIKSTEDPSTRHELVRQFVQRLGELSGPVQTAAIEQLRGASEE